MMVGMQPGGLHDIYTSFQNSSQYFVFMFNMWDHYTGALPGPTGCDWWTNRINHWTSQLPINNPNQLALKTAKIDMAVQMLAICDCPPVAPPNLLNIVSDPEDAQAQNLYDSNGEGNQLALQAGPLPFDCFDCRNVVASDIHYAPPGPVTPTADGFLLINPVTVTSSGPIHAPGINNFSPEIAKRGNFIYVQSLGTLPTGGSGWMIKEYKIITSSDPAHACAVEHIRDIPFPSQLDYPANGNIGPGLTATAQYYGSPNNPNTQPGEQVLSGGSVYFQQAWMMSYSALTASQFQQHGTGPYIAKIGLPPYNSPAGTPAYVVPMIPLEWPGVAGDLVYIPSSNTHVVSQTINAQNYCVHYDSIGNVLGQVLVPNNATPPNYASAWSMFSYQDDVFIDMTTSMGDPSALGTFKIDLTNYTVQQTALDITPFHIPNWSYATGQWYTTGYSDTASDPECYLSMEPPEPPCQFSDMLMIAMNPLTNGGLGLWTVYGTILNNPSQFYQFLDNMWNHYENSGCDWWLNRWTLWTSQLPNITNPNQILLKTAKINLAWEMIGKCGCDEPMIAPPIPFTDEAIVIDPTERDKNYNSNDGRDYILSEFVKEKDGIKAPAGFHYMDDGKLMSDANYLKRHGYIEKTITSFDINTKDLNYLGETRSFSISGENGAVFDLEIYDNSVAPVYYNFDTETWTTTKSGLNNIQLTGDYSFSIIFPVFVAESGGYENTKTFTVNLIAKTVSNIKTKHSTYSEVKNLDGSSNINKSKGSESDLITKTISQSSLKNLHLSCIAPSLTSISTDAMVGSVSGNIIHTTVANPRDKIAIGDKITSSSAAASIHVLVTAIDPNNNDPNEIQINQSLSFGAETLTYNPPFGTMTPNGTVSTSGRHTFTASTEGSFKRNFSILCRAEVGRTLSVFRIPTTDDLCAYRGVDFGDKLELPGEDVSGGNFGWSVDNVIGLQEGMILDPARTDSSGGAGRNTTTPASISNYSTTTSISKLFERKYYTDVKPTTVGDEFVKGVDGNHNPITAFYSNGDPRSQEGNIVFNVQQNTLLAEDEGVRIFAYGSDQIKSLTGMGVTLSNVVITPKQISTTTTAAVSNSRTIPVAETAHISTASTIRGSGITDLISKGSFADPTVTFKSKVSGAGDLTASTFQTLESGQTLYFDGASNELTITGTIEISNLGTSSYASSTLYFDVERFLRAV